MGMFIATVAALSTFYPEASQIADEKLRTIQIQRLIAKVPTIAAFSYRHTRGLPFIYPDNDLSYPGNFLSMMFKFTEPKYNPSPVLEHALDVLFILHADHEQNCSTNAMRAIGSSKVDPYSAMAGAAAALYGPLHGGANEAVLKMLSQIGDVKNIPAFIEKVKKGEGKLMGFGHRVYMGLPVAMFPVMFAIPRTVGWLTQWQEMLVDEEQKIARPRQVYLGKDKRDFVPMTKRK
jgi:citrate synthase